MAFRELTVVGALMGAVILTGCSGGNEPETPETEAVVSANEMIQDQVDRAQDVEIKDKKSLSKNQRIANAYLNGMNDVVTALESVSDEKSAEEAAKVMAKSGEMFDDLAKEIDGDGANRERALAMAMMSRQQEFMAVQQRMMGAMMKIQTQNPELMVTISDGMQKMNAK